MRRILKWSLPPVGEVRQYLGADAKVLAVGWQGRQLVAWGEWSQDTLVEPWVFTVALTGDAIPEGDYIGTASLDEDGTPHVVHVYGRKESLR